jgi:hypothetical protein
LEIDLLKACRAKGEVQAVQAFHHLRCSGSETMEFLEPLVLKVALSATKKRCLPPSHGNLAQLS